MPRLRLLLLLAPIFSWSHSLAGPQTTEGAERVGQAGRTGNVRIELISAATTTSFAGAVAFLERARFGPELTPLDRWNAPAALEAIPESGEIEFSGVGEGLYRLHLLDALGMPILDGPGPVWVSVVPGTTATYRVESKRLDEVEGVVLEDSVGRPIAGATLRVDPRFAVRGAPPLQVVTDEEGRYRVSTARSEVVAVDAPDYRTMNMRFGVEPVAGPLRLRPMLKRRSVVLDGSYFGGGVEPRLAYGSRLLASDGRSAFVPGSREKGGGYAFDSVLYDRGILYLPLREGAGELGPGATRLVTEFLIKRGGGAQRLDLPTPHLRIAGLEVLPPLAGKLTLHLAAHLDRHTSAISQSAWFEDAGQQRFLIPDPGKGDQVAGWSLSTRSSDGDEVSLEWRGSALVPGDGDSLGTVAAVQVGTTEDALVYVFDGDWWCHGRVRPDSKGVASLPHMGPGALYVSSPSVKGDLERWEIGAWNDVEPARVFEGRAGSCRLDLRALEGEDPIRGLSVYLVPTGFDLTDEALDLLGEIPLVTDASGVIRLRGFVPGEYEIRVDQKRSLDAAGHHSLRSGNLVLREGDPGPMDWPFGTSETGDGR
ncbi:hypothetical protein Poly30_12700 [Planctomycetes bacterium Poly30]|uniref:Carboxypeptidase regulatory-like domain-containing protein n=1 Tax=Saltatorellus ferox TaxID=2528018 RepID=A0A518ENV0_9BACT|nr:hypothetical protein Poly30_12700 [Planctomycetes bacterium Poly30]